MRTEDFDYNLPAEFIAQTAAQPRDSARLMVLHRNTLGDEAEIEHTIFAQLPRYLSAGDVLVLNQTKVIPARLYAHKKPSGGKVEVLLLKKENGILPNEGEVWTALLGGKNIKQDQQIEVEGGIPALIIKAFGDGRFQLRFEQPLSPLLSKIGNMPLPPYIKSYPKNPDDYQTVFAQDPGSAAAPTAGLHFTHELLEKIRQMGVRIEKITLHVGLDTFLPVHEEHPEDHKIHSEWCYVSQSTVNALRQAKESGKRIIAVGTTTVSTLETLAQVNPKDPFSKGYEGTTRLYILPGFSFQIVDAMITNFHLPKSTLLMLVCAFAGRERVLRAYETAKKEGYRFYSFGDAMLII